jgi:3-oxoacyl-(acyl-carrier-protein) synthase
MEAKTAKRSERSLQYGVAAAVLATRDAGLDMAKMNPDRAGIGRQRR